MWSSPDLIHDPDFAVVQRRCPVNKGMCSYCIFSALFNLKFNKCYTVIYLPEPPQFGREGPMLLHLEQ